MTREQAINYLFSSGFTNEQVCDVVRALTYEPTTKNNSSELEKNSKKLEKNFGELDCISRQATIDAIRNYFHDEYYQRTSIQDCRDCFIEDVLNDLPSVTPQLRKGHWILTDVEGNRIWFCNCSECGKDPQDYISGTENWWLTRDNLPKFCPNCGSDNREVKE